MITITRADSLAEQGILYDTDPVLRQVSEPVREFDAELSSLARRMVIAIAERQALGLAAIQLGIPKQIIVCKLMRGYTSMCNPVLVRALQRLNHDREGCLSIPPVKWGYVSRPAKCEVEWYDLAGNYHRDNFSGLDARIVQHEMDHLKGILMTDRM